MTEEATEVLEGTTRWRTRDVQYCKGPIERVLPLMPTFELCDFVAGQGSAANPYLKSVVRVPMSRVEVPMPVAVVSNSYGLVQHKEVAHRCLDGLRMAGVETTGLECELGLTTYGEWMNLRIYLPQEYDQDLGDGEPLQLRLECYNSVDGWNRLVIYFGWLRFVCGNGMVIGETKAEIRETHTQALDLDGVRFQIAEGMSMVEQDRRRLECWAMKKIDQGDLAPWADGALTQAWGKKAACRAFHICLSGHDVDISPPFAEGTASQKPIKTLATVPGAVTPIGSAYDASQALTWLASKRPDPDERLKWMLAVPSLIDKLVDAKK